MKKFGANKGAWAVVTGASDGIGKEFASQLGKAGFNVALVARNKEVLTQNAKEIGKRRSSVCENMLLTHGAEEKFKVQTIVHTIDFASAAEAEFDKFAAEIGALEVGVLGNSYLSTYLAVFHSCSSQ